MLQLDYRTKTRVKGFYLCEKKLLQQQTLLEGIHPVSFSLCCLRPPFSFTKIVTSPPQLTSSSTSYPYSKISHTKNFPYKVLQNLVKISTTKMLKIKFTYLEFTLCLSLVCILGTIGGVYFRGIFCDRFSTLNII